MHINNHLRQHILIFFSFFYEIHTPIILLLFSVDLLIFQLAECQGQKKLKECIIIVGHLAEEKLRKEKKNDFTFSNFDLDSSMIPFSVSSCNKDNSGTLFMFAFIDNHLL